MHALVSGGEAYEPAADDPAERLWAAVRTLPDKQREAVLLVYGEGMSHAGAADVMGSAEATVSWHIHEAKKRLKQICSRPGKTDHGTRRTRHSAQGPVPRLATRPVLAPSTPRSAPTI